MREFGSLIGMAFQIKDDLFDYGTQSIGKPTGIDIKEQKMTLPLIHALQQANPDQKRWMINTVKNHHTDRKRVQELIALVKELGGLSYATTQMNNYKEQALEILADYPDSAYKSALITMVRFVVEREK
jgi:octaprenyl-diphosphate synthase